MKSKQERERDVEYSMEQIKVLNLDLGRVCEDKKVLTQEAVELTKEQVVVQEKKEWDWITKSTRISIPGNDTKDKER